MRISAPGNSLLRLLHPKQSRVVPMFPSTTCIIRTSRGFTLLELLVVISIIAIASAGVAFSIRDSAETALEREGERLVALLETGRALSRVSGQAMRWRDTPQGFSFEGLNAGKLPKNWLSPGTTVQWNANARMLTLGPEPIIDPQTVTLVRNGRILRIETDGLRPFFIQRGF